MSEEKKGWDDIPSLEGLQMDWDYTGENPLGKRKFQRMDNGDVRSIFEVKAIPVRVATGDFTIDGTLNDISGGGLALILKRALAVGQRVKLGFFLGRQKIVSQAIVRQCAPITSAYKVGFEFHNIKEEDSQYINGLYASKALHL
jgi:c-di-GMP-binding flagellar brake protein YcgR